jgi:nicotinamide-nucleotide amidase
MSDPASLGASARLITVLTARQLTLAVAESLTGGLVIAELIGNPGASAVVLGGIVAYNTELKQTLLGVDAALLEKYGPVHPQVAIEMAVGVRQRLVVGGRPADIGLSTTGVAGPDTQSGQAPGTVFIGLARDGQAEARRLSLAGTRDQIRAAVVTELLSWLAEELEGE